MFLRLKKICCPSHIRQSGLSLIELLVAVALFAAVIVISSASFIRMIRSERAAAARQHAYDNARFVFENVARNIRVSDFCPNAEPPNFTDCGSMDTGPNRGKIIQIDHPTRIPNLITYRWDDVNNRLLENSAPLSGSEVFTSMWFEVEGVGLEGGVGFTNRQPRITIFGKIETQGIAEEDVVVHLQTTVTQRLLETRP